MERLARPRSWQACFGIHGKDLGRLPQTVGNHTRVSNRRANLIQVTFEGRCVFPSVKEEELVMTDWGGG